MKLYTNKVWLTREYTIKKKTVSQIASEQKVSAQTIQNYLVKFDLIRNPRSWGKRK